MRLRGAKLKNKSEEDKASSETVHIEQRERERERERLLRQVDLEADEKLHPLLSGRAHRSCELQ